MLVDVDDDYDWRCVEAVFVEYLVLLLWLWWLTFEGTFLCCSTLDLWVDDAHVE